MSTLTSIIRRAVWSRTHFDFWQKLGINVTRKHFYSPIPDTQELGETVELWAKESELPGINMNLEAQLQMLETVFAKYKKELNFAVDKTDNPCEFYLNNAGFGLEDAGTLHCMIRHFKPRTIIEVGSGNSTLVAARVSLMNNAEEKTLKLIAIEPYPREYLKKGIPGLNQLIIKKGEQMEVNFFDQLHENDILFIDSSHVVRTGNDVNFLYLEVLPRLKKGVVVHIHDIFLPYNYPAGGILNEQVFWSEQYLLQAFLCFNSSYEVLFGNYCMISKYLEKMRAVFTPPPGYHRHGSASFWIRKTI